LVGHALTTSWFNAISLPSPSTPALTFWNVSGREKSMVMSSSRE